ncbi:hypothetical protein GCM10009747_17710 [Agromyces humatus]|uniref:PKD domain-containing protein n=2 Tax=Agromyces humatus TaxID=279573 RepID=A0ABP4WNZ1_9MICO
MLVGGAAAGLILALTAAPPANACTPSQGFVGCHPNTSGTIQPDRVIIDALVQDDERSEVSDGGGGDGDGTATEPPPRGVVDVWSGPGWEQLCGANFQTGCSRPSSPTAPPPTPAPGAPAVTLRDIASFRPAEPSDVMEPNGWAVVGLPANFVAEARPEVVSGTLLGQPADVRFTPVGYRWVHSDGTTVTSPSPGATWSALGVAEFTPTDTSHVYAASGEYTVTLRVALAAEYRFAGSGWLPIAGTLTIDGASQRVLVGEVDTVLTVGDCTAYPSSPGC